MPYGMYGVEMMDNKELALYLKTLLIECISILKDQGIGDAQAELAERLDVNQGTISRWLNGDRTARRYSPQILRLHSEITGKQLEIPLAASKLDYHTLQVIQMMQSLTLEQRHNIESLVRSVLKLEEGQTKS